MNPFSSFSAEGVLRVCEIVAIGAGVLAVAALVGQIFAKRVVGQRQAEKILRLEGANIEAQRNLEAERTTRLEMERDIAPRLIPLIEHGGVTNIDDLKPYAGTGLVIEYAPDDEAKRAASIISSRAFDAGWKTLKADCPDDLIDFEEGIDGVVVEPYRRPKDKLSPELNPEEQQSKQAAEALVAFLKSHNWIARVGLGFRGELLPNSVKVKVGFKPMPYFLKPAIDAVKKRYETGQR